MHGDFSEWFRSAGMNPPADVLQKRWAGVEAIQFDADEIVSLTELFFGFFDGKDTYVAQFRKVFQDADSSFRMRDNNQELSVLAGAALVVVMDSDLIELGDLAALALVSSAAQNLRAAPCVAEIPERAVKHLGRRAVSRGKIKADDAPQDENKTELLKLRRELDVIGEESNVLWWIFGETSRDTGKRWSKCTVPQAALMAGKELADLARIAPGPASAAALLDRIVRHAKAKPPAQVAVKDAIASMPLDWRQKLAGDCCPDTLKNLRPISQGIKMSVELAANEAWVGALAPSTKIQRGSKIAPRLLAYQFFLECVLVSLWSKVK